MCVIQGHQMKSLSIIIIRFAIELLASSQCAHIFKLFKVEHNLKSISQFCRIKIFSIADDQISCFIKSRERHGIWKKMKW